MKIIGIVGKKKSGKTSLAKNILKYLDNFYIHHYVKLAFADPIKEFCYNVMGLTYEQCYGSDEDKNTLTKYKWENLPHYNEILREIENIYDADLIPTGFMAAREIFQEFGTGIFRRMNPNIWIEALDRKLYRSERPYSHVIIDDCRFKNEFDYLKSQNAYIIKLERGITGDNHQSEIDLNNYGEYDLTIPGSLNEHESINLFLGSYQF